MPVNPLDECHYATMADELLDLKREVARCIDGDDGLDEVARRVLTGPDGRLDLHRMARLLVAAAAYHAEHLYQHGIYEGLDDPPRSPWAQENECSPSTRHLDGTGTDG